MVLADATLRDIKQDSERVELREPSELDVVEVLRCGLLILRHESSGDPSRRCAQRHTEGTSEFDRWVREQEGGEADVERRRRDSRGGPIEHRRLARLIKDDIQ